MKTIPRVTAVALALTLLLSLCGCGAADGKTHLTFQIWDVYQRDSMVAICDAYTAKNPDVVIDVQVTRPDILWMHTNQILYYTEFGMLADVTNLYDDVDPQYYEKHFSDISRGNAQGSDGRMYGVPKDKDNIVLAYNKEMFDAAGVAYPDENWTWDDMVDASQKVYDATGKYGYMAYNDDQCGYWNFVYQTGGCILTEDKTKGGFDQEGTRKAMDFYIGIQDQPWCPKQAYFAETTPQTAFFSEGGCMYLEGNWNLWAMQENFPEMRGKWDIAPLPKCPDPVQGDGRATISNGLCYSTAAHGKTRDIALDVIKFFGTEEAQLIASGYGAAVSAYNGTEQPYFDAFANAGYDLDLEIINDQFEYGVQSVNNSARPKWKAPLLDELNKVYNGQQSFDTGMDNIQNIINTETAKKLANE